MTVRRRKTKNVARVPKGTLSPLATGNKILLIHNPRNPAYRRICDAVVEFGERDYLLKSSTEIEREDFNGTMAVYATHWGVIDCVPSDYQGKIIIGVWEGDSWLSEQHLSEGAHKAFGRASAIFAANQGFANKIRLLAAKPVHVTTDGVDTMLFKPMVHLRPRGDKLRVGIVGCNWRGDDHKGIEIARKACGIAGVELVVQDAKNGSGVYIPHKEMPLWYNRLDALLICSQEEGGPNPGLEACACGLPVISTRVGVMGELVGEEWLCDRTADDFAQKLRDLQEMNPGDRKKLGRKNRDRLVAGGWAWEKKGSGIDGMISSAISFDYSNQDIQRVIEILDQPAPIPRVVYGLQQLCIGGAQTAAVRWLDALPEWVKNRAAFLIGQEIGNAPIFEEAVREQYPSLPELTTGYVPRDATAVVCSFWRPNFEDLLAIERSRCRLILPVQNCYAKMHRSAFSGIKFDSILYASEGSRLSVSPEITSLKKSRVVEEILDPIIPPAKRLRNPRDHTDNVRVVYVGRANGDKAFDALAWMLAADTGIEVIAFSGVDNDLGPSGRKRRSSYLDRFKSLLGQLGVSDRFHWRDHQVLIDDLSPMYVDSHADALIITSPSEGFCMAVAESLEHGLPVAVTNGGNPASMVRDGVNGAVYSYTDDMRLLGERASLAVRRAALCDDVKMCRSSVAKYSHPSWSGSIWREALGVNLTPNQANPIVTVAVIHDTENGRREDLDFTMAAIAGQTERSFTTLLCTIGPWERTKLGKRYEVPAVFVGRETSALRVAANCSLSEWVWVLKSGDRPARNLLSKAIKSISGKADIPHGMKLIRREDLESPKIETIEKAAVHG